MEQLKVLSIFGTRPEAIKMCPLVKELQKTPEIISKVCITGQHKHLLQQVLDIFQITPEYNLEIMQKNQSLAEITSRALNGVFEILQEARPDLVLVHGDTSTALAAALAAFYARVRIGHVEAGLRTNNMAEPFPEEANRSIIGRLADIHFAPTALASENLLKENILPNSIFVTGNTAIDAISHTIDSSYIFRENALNAINFAKKRIITLTAHRRENYGKPLQNICYAILKLLEDFGAGDNGIEFVYPVHPSPIVSETVYGLLGNNPKIHLISPIDIEDMHNLIARSYLVLTDSGGIQEEAPFLNKPVVVLRNVTERPEGITAGCLALGGVEIKSIYQKTSEILQNETLYKKMAESENPFGDGKASARIVKNILKYFAKEGL